MFNVRTRIEDRPVDGAESMIVVMPPGLYVTVGDKPALHMRRFGRLIRQLSEAGAHLVEEDLHHAEWVITTDPAVVEERGMHGHPECASCRNGTNVALEALATDPEQELLVGTLYYAGPAA